MTKVSILRPAIRHGLAGVAFAAVTGFVLFGGTPTVQAATATATLAVSASIAGACTVGGAAMSFGAYTASAASTANSTIQVTCTNGTSASVALNQGNNNNRVPSAGTRGLNNGTNYLGYDIFADSGYATIWNVANAQLMTSTGSPVTFTAYGRIPAGQSPATGSYNDTVTITVTF